MTDHWYITTIRLTLLAALLLVVAPTRASPARSVSKHCYRLSHPLSSYLRRKRTAGRCPRKRPP